MKKIAKKKLDKTSTTLPNAPQMVIPEKKSNNIVLSLIAFIIPALLYLQTLSFGFTNFDDDGVILNNIDFLSNFKNAPRVFFIDAFVIKMSPFYRPLQTLSYMIDIQLSGGNNAWMYHLTNILLLALIALSLFNLLKRFLIPADVAVLATLIYCAHPLFVSSIAWIPARGDLMLLLFSLLSVLLLIDYLRTQKLFYLLLQWLAFTLALFCKETAAFLPFIFVFYYTTFTKRKLFEKNNFIALALYALSGITWYGFRAQSIGDFSNRSDVFGPNAILSNFRVIPESLTLFFFPFNIEEIPGFTLLKTAVGCVILVAIAVLFNQNKSRPKKEKLFFISWYFLLLMPTLLFKHILIDYLDHRFFMPLIGMFLFLLYIIPKPWIQQNNRNLTVTMVVVFLIFSSFTFINSRSYTDPNSFYTAAANHNSNSALSFNNRGGFKVKKNDLDGAFSDFDKAIKIYPDYDQAYYNRGCVKSLKGDNTGAIEDLTTAIRLRKTYAEAHYQRGLANNALGHFNEAINDFNNYIGLRPNITPEAYNYRGTAYGSTGNYQEAIINFNKAIELHPTYLEAFGNRSIARYQVKDLAGSLQDCEKVLELSPGNANAMGLKATIDKELLAH